MDVSVDFCHAAQGPSACALWTSGAACIARQERLVELDGRVNLDDKHHRRVEANCAWCGDESSRSTDGSAPARMKKVAAMRVE